MRRSLAAAGLLLLAVSFVALGVWQLERRSWKLRLIASVDARVHAPSVPAPPPRVWPAVSAKRDAYRRVRVTGTFDHAATTLVQAVTERGAGWWMLTPLRTAAGWTVLVNRGFVPDAGVTASRPDGLVTVVGLLRMTEPRGGFLRSNDPTANRWYSRDVAAIARARGLSRVAPYFIDAAATPDGRGYPVGGMTVIAFRNTHLVYALTWFGLAGLALVGLRHVLRER